MFFPSLSQPRLRPPCYNFRFWRISRLHEWLPRQRLAPLHRRIRAMQPCRNRPQLCLSQDAAFSCFPSLHFQPALAEWKCKVKVKGFRRPLLLCTGFDSFQRQPRSLSSRLPQTLRRSSCDHSRVDVASSCAALGGMQAGKNEWGFS